MGDCYSVEVYMKVKAEKGKERHARSNLAAIMRTWMKSVSCNGRPRPHAEKVEGIEARFPGWVGVNWDFAGHRRRGTRPSTIDGQMKILLADRDYQEVRKSTDEAGFDSYQNCFNATYSWGAVMRDFFRKMSPWLEDGSYIEIDRDEGVDHLEIDEGELWEQTEKRPREGVENGEWSEEVTAKPRKSKSARKNSTAATKAKRSRRSR